MTKPITSVAAMMLAEEGTPRGADLAECCARWAALPLLFQPGAEWNYSVATDLLGRLVEVVSGVPLDEFFASRIFTPLGITDTGFVAPARLAAMYVRDPASGRGVRNDAFGRLGTARPDCLSGGGALNGVRLLAPRTVSLMARVDPDEDLTVGFYTQLLPSSTYRLRPQLRQLVYQALVD